jgi:hypothetical protein
MVEKLSKAYFSEALNTPFHLHTDTGESLDLELIELKDGFALPGQEQFSLKFRGPGQSILPQKTYRMDHDRIGPFDLFIVPIGRGADDTYYEAVFNRSIES